MTNDELLDDLDAYMLGDDELEPPADDETIPPPPDAEHADALARVLRGVEREQRRIEMLATQEISRITAWRDDRLSGLNRRHASISSALEGWMRAVNRLNPKRKTEHLPHAKVSLRAPRRSTVVTDAAAFVDWWRERVRSEVAVYLRTTFERIGGDRVSWPEDLPIEAAAEVVEVVLSRSPLVKIHPEPSKTGVAEAGAEGEPIASGTDVVMRGVVVDGELVPGVAFAKPTADTFTVAV